MTVPVDIWLKGDDFATNESIPGHRARAARLDRRRRAAGARGHAAGDASPKHPGAPGQAVALRGFSWIVNPYEAGGVVIAIEITLGAAVAGPFDIDQARLEAMIGRVLARRRGTVVAGALSD